MFVSVSVLAHAPLQLVCPALQQIPVVHDLPPVQALPQLPQLLLLVFGS